MQQAAWLILDLHAINSNLWIYGFHMTGNTDMHLLVTDTLKKGRGVDQKSSQYLVWPPFASCSATDLLHVKLIRLLIVSCGMLSQSSSMAGLSCCILAGTGTRCRTRQSRASQTCSMGDMSGEYAGHGRTGTFSALFQNILFSANSAGGHSCSQHTKCMLPQLEIWSVALCCVTTAHFSGLLFCTCVQGAPV